MRILLLLITMLSVSLPTLAFDVYNIESGDAYEVKDTTSGVEVLNLKTGQYKDYDHEGSDEYRDVETGKLYEVDDDTVTDLQTGEVKTYSR